MDELLNEPLPIQFNLQTHDRVTGSVNFYQEHWGEEPFVAGARFSECVETQEQPFQRRTMVGPEWMPLSKIWGGMLSSAGLLLVENRTGKNLQVNPTQGELDEINLAVVELGVHTGEAYVSFARIRPGLFAVVDPPNADLIYMRSPVKATVTVTAFPR